jgi:transcriptional regulator with XRE-family HTH domain
MTSQLQQVLSRDDTVALRREGGAWLKEKREAAGLSQRELAAKVGIEYYTFISQIEAGRGRVPAERFEAYASALKVSARDFTMTMLRYNEPIVFRLLADPKDEVQAKPASLSELEERLRRLEARLVD